MRPVVGASTKMNLTSTEARAYLLAVRPLLEPCVDVDTFVLPPFTALWVARECLSGSAIAWGAQDVHAEDAGAHTGDISAPMLTDLGCRYVAVGHAERRRDHGESDEIVAAKVAQVLRHRMTPILCIGETTRSDLRAARAAVLVQLERGLARVPEVVPAIVADGASASLIVAYEPVWAIGQGAASADPEHIAAIHVAIAERLRSLVPATLPVRVIYGGSVDPRGAPAILATPGVDGLFVGRAALDPRMFASIVAAAQAHAGRAAVGFTTTHRHRVGRPCARP
jgi:triosephosphate isomerase